jgi:hypothetical protein
MYRSKKSEERKGNRDGRKTSGTEKKKKKNIIKVTLLFF